MDHTSIGTIMVVIDSFDIWFHAINTRKSWANCVLYCFISAGLQGQYEQLNPQNRARTVQDDVRALADLLCMGHGLSVEQVGRAGDVALQEGFHLTHVDQDERPVPL